MRKKDIETDEDYELYFEEKTNEKILNDYFGENPKRNKGSSDITSNIF